jgi:L-ascorbate metabolism protein UlaG (beta-lactamase superfamily)
LRQPPPAASITRLDRIAFAATRSVDQLHHRSRERLGFTPGGVRIATDYSGAYITRRLRASVVLPMHRFMTPLDEFMRRIGERFAIDVRAERTLRISRETLPGTPTVIILDGV